MSNSLDPNEAGHFGLILAQTVCKDIQKILSLLAVKS